MRWKIGRRSCLVKFVTRQVRGADHGAKGMPRRICKSERGHEKIPSKAEPNRSADYLLPINSSIDTSLVASTSPLAFATGRFAVLQASQADLSNEHQSDEPGEDGCYAVLYRQACLDDDGLLRR